MTPTAYVAPDTIYGVQVFESDAIPAVLNAAAAAGARYARFRVLWDYVEPIDTTPPTYLWGGVDQAISRLRQHGLTPIGNIYGHPDWAASSPCGPIDRVPLSRYGAFLSDLVERYDGDGTSDAPGSPRVAFWEISNEPDFDPDHAGGEPDYGGCFGGQPDDFGRYLRTAHAAVKSADATATVVFGGIAYDRFYNKSGYSPAGPFDYDFLGDVLDWLYANHGTEPAWPFFDWMAVHVYNDFRNNWDGVQPYNQEMLGKIKHLRDNQMLHVGWYDLRSVPLAVTEASIASMPSDVWTARSESIQSAYPGRLLLRARSAGVRQVTWYSMEDHKTGSCGDPYAWMGLGLLRSLDVYEAAQRCTPNPIPDYAVSGPHERKPAHTAYAVAVAQLAGATYDRQWSVGETGSAQVEAYAFTSGGAGLLAAFTDNGERLGRIGSPPVTRTLELDASNLPGWTGTVAITDHLGDTTYESGSSVTVTITQWPVYVRPH